MKALFRVKDDELDFAAAIRIASKVEDAAKVAKKTVYSNTTDNKVHTIQSGKNQNKKKKKGSGGTNLKCGRCNSSSHSSDSCRFKDAVCYFCNSVCHVQNACRKKEREKKSDVNKISDFEMIKQVDREWVDSPKLELIFNLSSESNNVMHIPLELDTGAKSNFLSVEIWTRLGKPKLTEVKTCFKSASKDTIPILGKCTVRTSKLGSSVSMPVVFVVTRIQDLNLLGRVSLKN